MSIDRECRICHCTDFSACMTEDGPCCWIDDDLCSACADTMDSHALRDVVDERARQARAEGFTLDHDDALIQFELAHLASTYVVHASLWDDDRLAKEVNYRKRMPIAPTGRKGRFKPTTRRRDLVKAAALILAEIERLDRAEPGE